MGARACLLVAPTLVTPLHIHVSAQGADRGAGRSVGPYANASAQAYCRPQGTRPSPSHGGCNKVLHFG